MHPLKVSGSLHAPPAPFSFKDNPVLLVATVRLCISYRYSVTLINEHNTPDPIYPFYTQHCKIFQLSASAIVMLPLVHTKNKKLEVSPNKQRCKLVIVKTVIPHKMSNYMKACVIKFPVKPNVVGQTQNKNVIYNKTKQKFTKSVAQNSRAVYVLYCGAGAGLPYNLVLFVHLGL